MHVKQLILLTLLLPLACVSIAQDNARTGNSSIGYGASNVTLFDHLLVKMADNKLGYEKDLNMDGTPFAKEEYIEGIVYGKDKEFQPTPMRYNIYLDNMEFVNNDRVYALDPSMDIKKVKIGDETFVVAKSKKGKLGYYTLCEDGAISILEKRTVSIRPAKQAGALESSNTPAKFMEPKSTYFALFEGNTNKLKNAKQLIALFPQHSSALKDHYKSLSGNKLHKLKKLALYYNQNLANLQ